MPFDQGSEPHSSDQKRMRQRDRMVRGLRGKKGNITTPKEPEVAESQEISNVCQLKGQLSLVTDSFKKIALRPPQPLETSSNLSLEGRGSDQGRRSPSSRCEGHGR